VRLKMVLLVNRRIWTQPVLKSWVIPKSACRSQVAGKRPSLMNGTPFAIATVAINRVQRENYSLQWHT